MSVQIQNVVVVGGGSAGYITACRIAAEYLNTPRKVQITLVESPDIPIIGVGEGTWPSMRTTLQEIGLSEDDLLRHCEATFKQGTSFVGWQGLEAERDRYLHPFTPPADYSSLNLANYWLASEIKQPFAGFVTEQGAVVDAHLAPKQVLTPQYAFNLNYAYHFDAGKFAAHLKQHATQKLGVVHVSGNLAEVESEADGSIKALLLEGGTRVEGDLFVDCTGQRSLLIGEHLGIKNRSVRSTLFNDRALVVQVPYPADDMTIASTTRATAHESGWVWDIGLQTRRGIGCVYASDHTSKETALQTLHHYVETDENIRELSFEPAYKEQPWVKNCVAVGLSAGFVEPLEASALALVEQAARLIAQQLPRDKPTMMVVANRFNDKMQHHWQRIVEFLKLHYVLSQRQSEYWRLHRDENTWPDGLREKIELWHQQCPWHDDAPLIDELFPSASYQYVLYGMGFRPRYPIGENTRHARNLQRADRALQEVVERSKKLVSALPGNRQLIRERMNNTQLKSLP